MRVRLLIVGISVLVLGAVGITIALIDRTDPPSADCQQVERALQPWGRTMPSAYGNLPPDIDPDPRGERDFPAVGAAEAEAANDIRVEAQRVQSADLRALVNEVADSFDLLSRSRLAPSAPSAPSKDFFAATNRMNEALHDIKRACPGIANDPLPPVSG